MANPRQTGTGDAQTDAVLPGAPLEGSVVILLSTQDPLDVDWVDLAGAMVRFGGMGTAGFRMWGRIAGAGEDGTYGFPSPADYTIAEFEGDYELTPLDPQTATAQAASTHAHLAFAPVHSGDVLILGGIVHDNSGAVTPDAGYTLAESFLKVANGWTFDLVFAEEPNAGSYDPGATYVGSGGWGAIVLALPSATLPSDPPVDPGYTPPGPARAILEIYVHDESASHWGEATWATGPATGTEGVWSGAGWQDVTPEGVLVHVLWGAQRPERGILADQDAASWNVQTYDPERELDPGNPDSPWYPQLVPGLPIRVSHDTFVTRTGIVDHIAYDYKAPEYQGTILATDAISLLNQAMVPESSTLGDTLVERTEDAIAAADIAVGGISLYHRPYGIRGVADYQVGPDLSAQQPGEVSVWGHIKEAAREVLHVAFIHRLGGLGFRPWGKPLGPRVELSAPLLEDMVSVISEDGVYSVVRVKDATGASEIERVADPLPRYGRRVYARALTTIDPDAFADAVLADRAWPGVQWRPGTIRPRTAADAQAMAGIGVMSSVLITVPGVVSVPGVVLGGELWVQHRAGADGAEWRFRFSVVTDGSAVLGTTTLVSDQAGGTLLDDDTGTDYLTPDP